MSGALLDSTHTLMQKGRFAIYICSSFAQAAHQEMLTCAKHGPFIAQPDIQNHKEIKQYQRYTAPSQTVGSLDFVNLII